jgi:hypothetical protein
MCSRCYRSRVGVARRRVSRVSRRLVIGSLLALTSLLALAMYRRCQRPSWVFECDEDANGCNCTKREVARGGREKLCSRHYRCCVESIVVVGMDYQAESVCSCYNPKHGAPICAPSKDHDVFTSTVVDECK